MDKRAIDELTAFAIRHGYSEFFGKQVAIMHSNSVVRHSQYKGKYLDFKAFNRILKIEYDRRHRIDTRL